MSLLILQYYRGALELRIPIRGYEPTPTLRTFIDFIVTNPYKGL